MARIAKQYQDELPAIKENVKRTYEGMLPNYKRFNEFRRFVFETSYSSDDIELLTTQSKPQLEFNIGETFISRLMGEFSKQEPAISVHADDEDKADPVTIHVVEQHIRHLLMDSKNHNMRWEIMKDIYSGGFSVGKLGTDYAHAMSMDQIITLEHANDPTLCGFDLMARQSHKGDGEFCFELFPYTKETFQSIFPEVNIKKINFHRAFSSFTWSYLNDNQKVILVCEYYKKKKTNIQIVRLANDKVVTLKRYKEIQENWGDIMQIPAIKEGPRWTTTETICRYRCIEDQVLDYEETDFTIFPLIFFDGNSIMLKTPKTSGSVSQITRPYLYHAKGAQKLKNYAGVTLANALENIVQHKFMVAKEALPKEQDWLMAYKDIQKPSNIIYNAYYEQNPDQPIPNPIQQIQSIPTPPEVSASFTMADSLMQSILGNYDASLGINDNQLSGIAIVEGATQSNSAAMPYVIGFLQGMQRMAEGIVDLIPKYIKTPRTIPVRGIDGKADYVKVNQPNGVSLFYDENVLNVVVEAGVSFQIQKSRALQQLIALQSASPLFQQFMNEKGLGVLLDNIEIRGIDQLKLMVEDWEKELAQQKQMAMQQQQQQMQNNPVVMRNQIEIQKLQQQQQDSAMEHDIHQKQLALDYAKLKTEHLKTMAELKMAKEENETERQKAATERYSKQVDLQLRHKDMKHQHHKDLAEFKHKVVSDHLNRE